VPTVFLDIHAKIAFGGERGLLGLAFHPQYAANGRLFIYYTRVIDGAIVIAEYRVSADPNVASPSGTTLLQIPHSLNTNHNGGMLAFGPDGYLYIGVGDGGSANDPPNNAQNANVLLGKLLRIDVDRRDTVNFKMYVSPSDNPYAGKGSGRPEIFSLGWRNPWRFSFDRSTHQQWVADVGQDAREEVDTPIVKGGNYGWRVYEGFACSGNDPSLCNPANYIFPVFDYTHTNGRCAITGGYVYRGSQNALPQGTYVYGDYCSGEIFAWDGAAQSIVLDTQSNISSFGEDEQGEIYVVGLEGSLSRIVGAGPPPCKYAIAPPTQSVGVAGGGGNVAVTTADGCVWAAVSNADWIHAAAGGSGNGNVAYTVDANPSTSARTGTATIAGQTFSVNQQGSVACSYSVSPSYGRLQPSARSATVKVTTADGCGWFAVSQAEWITIDSGAAGSGNGAVTYSVTALPSRTAQRTGTMRIAGRTVTIVQLR
jgi:hypothetical protein